MTVMNPSRLRALELAIEAAKLRGDGPSGIVQLAETFHEFLTKDSLNLEGNYGNGTILMDGSGRVWPQPV